MDVVQKESATPETAFGKYGQFFALLNPNVCEYMPQGAPFTLEETITEGEAVITITPESPCLAVRNLDKVSHVKQLRFLNDDNGKENDAVRKCADHIVFLFANGNWILHVFECKKSQKTKRLQYIANQFSGAVIRAYAIAGVLRIAEFSRVYLHRCYREDKSSPAETKSFPGKPVSEDFLKGALPSYPELAVKDDPIELNQDGYADIRLHKRGVTRN